MFNEITENVTYFENREDWREVPTDYVIIARCDLVDLLQFYEIAEKRGIEFWQNINQFYAIAEAFGIDEAKTCNLSDYIYIQEIESSEDLGSYLVENFDELAEFEKLDSDIDLDYLGEECMIVKKCDITSRGFIGKLKK